MSVLQFIKFAHLFGLILGFGCAMLADYLVLRHAILRPITKQLSASLAGISRGAFFGLLVLWLSGFALIAYRYLENPQVMGNEKLWAKVVIVTILSLNGFFVHHHALRVLPERVGRRLFDGASRPELVQLTLIASVSSVSWIVPMFLGVAPELNFKVDIATVLGIYAILVGLMWCGMLLFVTKAAPLVAEISAARRVRLHTIQSHEDVHQRYLELLNRVKSMAA